MTTWTIIPEAFEGMDPTGMMLAEVTLWLRNPDSATMLQFACTWAHPWSRPSPVGIQRVVIFAKVTDLDDKVSKVIVATMGTDHPVIAMGGAEETSHPQQQPLADVQGACLRWIGGIFIGGRGGYPLQVVQRIAACAAQGGDWQAIRDAHHARPKVKNAIAKQRRVGSAERGGG